MVFDHRAAYNVREWPLGFLDCLFGAPDAMPELPPDFEGSLAYALSTLEPRYQEIIKDRFIERLTYEDISSKHGISRERVRQIICKAMRLLRHPSRMRFIHYGVTGVINREKEAAAGKARMRAEDEIRKKAILEIVSEKEVEMTERKAALFATNLEDMHLSVRAYNCLRCLGCNCAGDILCLTADKLRRARNLGKKTHNEIVGKLEAMGFDVEHLRRREKHEQTD